MSWSTLEIESSSSQLKRLLQWIQSTTNKTIASSALRTLTTTFVTSPRPSTRPVSWCWVSWPRLVRRWLQFGSPQGAGSRLRTTWMSWATRCCHRCWRLSRSLASPPMSFNRMELLPTWPTWSRNGWMTENMQFWPKDFWPTELWSESLGLQYLVACRVQDL